MSVLQKEVNDYLQNSGEFEGAFKADFGDSLLSEVEGMAEGETNAPSESQADTRSLRVDPSEVKIRQVRRSSQLPAAVLSLGKSTVSVKASQAVTESLELLLLIFILCCLQRLDELLNELKTTTLHDSLWPSEPLRAKGFLHPSLYGVELKLITEMVRRGCSETVNTLNL
jgi:hypothetical protein